MPFYPGRDHLPAASSSRQKPYNSRIRRKRNKHNLDGLHYATEDQKANTQRIVPPSASMDPSLAVSSHMGSSKRAPSTIAPVTLDHRAHLRLTPQVAPKRCASSKPPYSPSLVVMARPGP
ncbi:hypothetical protein BDV09DRAFT_159308 [Aspergillus tetrazonus]